MKSRILDTLELLAKGQHVMSGDLMRELDISDSELSARADHLLRSILHNYSFFAVTTIDAFFQKIVRSFAREIGIQTGFKIELDQPKIISEVIDQMLSEMTNDAQLVRWLTSFAIYQINQGKSWDTRRDINNLSKELFNEFLVLNKDKVFGQLDHPGFVEEFVAHVHDKLNQLTEGMTGIGREIGRIYETYGLSADDFAYKSAGVGGYLDKIINGEFADPGKRVYEALEQGKWYSNNSERKEIIDQALAAGLADQLSKALDYYLANNREYQSLSQVVTYIYTFGLLSRIADELNNYREANDLLLISDFPIFLNQIINDSDAPYIYEKVGTRYKHYLIDEFQDTSGLQWNNFKPLILDSLAAGNFSMVVGDVKQSIYRWRGGNWKILLEQIKHDIGEQYIRNEGLSTNRRSKQNIVEFNNDLFDFAPQLLTESLSAPLGQAINSKLNIDAAYTGSSQQLFDESGEGLINIHFYEKNEDIDNPDDYVVAQLVNQIQYLQDANYNLDDIAILVRTNTQGRKIVKGLMDYQLNHEKEGYRYDVISNESLFIKNNAAVHLVLQALNLMSAPNQALSSAQLKYAYRQYHASDDLEFDLAGLPLEQWSILVFSDLVRKIISYFDLEKRETDQAYLLAFQDLILDFLKFEKDNLNDFLDWWQDHDSRSIQVSEDQQAIRLMTVHKSKGLQFKAVLVPYCQWKLDHSGPGEQLLWCSTQGSETLNKVPFVPVRYKTDLSKTLFDDDYYQEKSDVFLDNLNLLYVALTRAEEALFLTIQRSPSSRNMTQVGDLLHAYCSKKELFGDHPMSVRIGQLPAYSRYDQKLTDIVPLRSRKNVERKAQVKLRQKGHILDENVVESINYGQIIHWIFSLIRTKADFTTALDKTQIKFGLTDEEMTEIKSKLREIWDIPQISTWFEPDWEVKNESAILLTNGKLKRPDRVIVKNNDAIVIDYKTGVYHDRHISQVREYKNILNDMGYNNVDGYLIYLSKPELITV